MACQSFRKGRGNRYCTKPLQTGKMQWLSSRSISCSLSVALIGHNDCCCAREGKTFPFSGTSAPFEPNSVIMKMEAVHSAETSGQIYYLVQCENPEDCQLSSEILCSIYWPVIPVCTYIACCTFDSLTS